MGKPLKWHIHTIPTTWAPHSYHTATAFLSTQVLKDSASRCKKNKNTAHQTSIDNTTNFALPETTQSFI